MRILFYEPDHTGHHFAYLGRMLPGFVDLPAELVLACTQLGASSDEFRMHLAPFADRLKVEPVCDASSHLASRSGKIRRSTFALLGLHRVREFTRLTRDLRADHAIIMYGDGLWQWVQARSMLGLRLADIPVEMGLFRGGFTYEDASGAGVAIRRHLFARMVKARIFARLCIYDELFHRFAQSKSGPKGPQLTLMPDPVEIRPPLEMGHARAQLGIDPDKRWLVCAGMIDQRKGCDLALKAFAQILRDAPHPSLSLLLAGPHSEPIRALLKEQPFAQMVTDQRVVSLDRFLSTEEMFAAAAAGEIILAPYPNHSGRSSIILWAGAAGRPCIGSARGAIGEMIRSQNLGSVVQAGSIDDLASGIRLMLESPWTNDDQQRVRAHAQQHSFAEYQRLASERVRAGPTEA